MTDVSHVGPVIVSAEKKQVRSSVLPVAFRWWLTHDAYNGRVVATHTKIQTPKNKYSHNSPFLVVDHDTIQKSSRVVHFAMRHQCDSPDKSICKWKVVLGIILMWPCAHLNMVPCSTLVYFLHSGGWFSSFLWQRCQSNSTMQTEDDQSDNDWSLSVTVFCKQCCLSWDVAFLGSITCGQCSIFWVSSQKSAFSHIF